MQKQYMAYKGDKFLSLGTMREIARDLGVSYDHIRRNHWRTRHHKVCKNGIQIYELERDSK